MSESPLHAAERQPAPDLLLAGEAELPEELERGAPLGQATRAYVETVRGELRHRHFAGAGGSAIVFGFTAAIDRLLRALYRCADREGARRFPKLNQRLAVLARGGYGRGELNPQSDIDLLFLYDYKPGPYVEIVTEIMLHALWDAGLAVGQAVRNPRQSVRAARDDLKEKTALLDARFLIGDETLYAAFDKAFIAEVLNHDQEKFFRAKRAESRERHRRYGDSIYLLEPHIKEGEGGLRDLHSALWLAKVKYRVSSLDELVHKAVITQADRDQVEAARDFIWRVRNTLHFLSGRHLDQLTFEYQELIAPVLGFAASDGREAAAGLMRAYYQNATTIYGFAEGLTARVTEEPAAGGLLRRAAVRRIRPGVIISQGLLSVVEKDFFRRAPLNLLTVFADCQMHGVGLSGNSYQLVRDSLGLVDDTMRRDPKVGAALLGILGAEHRVAETLEAMHRASVLGAIIPEFGNLYARVLRDLYHIYTVDRHSLAAVGELERLRAGKYKASAALLTEVAREFHALPLVFLALLLHDIGKGLGHDHHERGALLTSEVLDRIGLGSEAAELVVFLVRNHLSMSEVAQKGDVDEQRTVEDFAREVGSIERLKALYLLTFADMRAVAPNVYNNWRDQLLSDLYMKTLKILEQGDRETVDPARRLALVKSAVRGSLAKAGAASDDIERFIALMPERYLLTAPESDIPVHFEMMRALSDERPLICRHRHFPELEFSEFIVVTRDRPGLFAKIAGVLTANNLNILSARINTRADGVALDVFRVSHPAGAGVLAAEEERWLRIERELEAVLAGKVEVERLVTEAQKQPVGARRFVRRVATEVTVDNRSSEQFTVVDVFTQDRIGLLFAITHTLFRLGMVIHLARISTNADQALDVFYISDREGRKITDLDRMRELKAALTEKVEENPTDGARP